MEKDKLENLKFKLLNRQFLYNQQGYNLIKCMTFRYVLNEINISIPSIKDHYMKLNPYFAALRELIEQNLDKITEKLGANFRELVLDCIVSFSQYSESDSGVEQALLTIENMSQEDIKNFIIYQSNDFGGKDNFSTPETLSNLAGAILKTNNFKLNWLDIGCGNGDFLTTNAINHPSDCFTGIEIHYNSSLLTKIRLTFLGVNSYVRNENILEIYDNLYKYDCVFAHIPFNVRLNFLTKDAPIDYFNNSNKYIGKLKPSQTAEWLFIDRALQNLSQNGKAVIIVPEGILFNSVDIEQRANLVNQRIIECIIKLPSNLFANTAISTSLLVLSLNNKEDYIKFIDASNLCIKGRRLSELNVNEILDEYTSNGGIKVPYDKIHKENYNLSVKRYKDVDNIDLINPIKLKDLVTDIYRGFQIQAKLLDKYSTNDQQNDTYKIVNPGDLEDGTFDINNLEMIKSEKDLDRYLLQDYDVLLSSKSTKIKTAIAEIKDNEKIIPSGSIIVVRCDKNKINPVYLKTFLDSTNGKKLLESIQTGTTIISINPSALNEMNISCLPIEKQNLICNAFLTKMDLLKIEKRKIKKLEEELCNIFDSNTEE